MRFLFKGISNVLQDEEDIVDEDVQDDDLETDDERDSNTSLNPVRRKKSVKTEDNDDEDNANRL